MFLRVLAATAVAVAVAVAPGCGPEAPKFDPATRYTPDSLAQELAFRLKALGPRRSAARPSTRKAVGREVGKSAEATKAAPAETLDDLVAETARKANTIPGLPTAEALKQVADAIGRETSIAEPDRRRIAELLNHPAEPL